MGSIDPTPRHQQICWSASEDRKQSVSVIAAKDEDRDRDRVLQERYRETPRPGTDPSQEVLSAHPMLSDPGFVRRLEEFNEVLVKVVVNIVDRWWDDDTADFPSRMPLEAHLEDALQWVHEQSKSKSVAGSLGHWRPDFVLTDNDSSTSGNNNGFQLCEINSRAPYNALIFTAYKHGVLTELLDPHSTLDTPGEMNDMLDSLLGLFNLELPIHIVKGRDQIKRLEFALLVEKRTGLRPRFVNVSDLQLRPDPASPTGYALYCDGQGQRGSGEDKQQLERVHQIALSLFWDEYSSLSQEMLRHIAQITTNDLRVNLLVNDERFLGIILQELHDLINKHKIITSEQGKILRDGIVPTILPGSPELESKRTGENNLGKGTKNDYILKASRQSRGEGHLLGEALSEEQWETHLRGMKESTSPYVLQPYIRQPQFDIIVDKTRTVPNSYIVGTYYVINGRFLGMGPWRSGNQKICNVFGGSCVLVSSVTLADHLNNRQQ